MDNKVFDLLEKMYIEFSKRFDGVDKRFDGVDKRFDGVEKKVQENSYHILRLENKLDENSKALFDGYKQTYEGLMEVKQEVRNLSSRLDKQEVEIKVIKGGKI